VKEVNIRFEYIDICKGIGIICVVLAHLGIAHRYLYMFHMPLFFFLSGMLFRRPVSSMQFITDRAIQLLIPYIIYLTLVYSIQEYEYFKIAPITTNSIFLSTVHAILGGRWLSSYTTVFWFITCLFFVQVCFNLLLGLFSKKKINIIILVSIVAAYINASYFAHIKFPWNINTVLMALPVYYIGYRFKSAVMSLPFILLCFVLSAIGIALIYHGYDNYFDMKVAKYGIPILTLSISISVTITIILVSKKIEVVPMISNLLSRIGSASLIIMYLHQLIIIILSQYYTSNIFILISLSIAIPCFLYNITQNFRVTRILFLGSKKDFYDLKILSNRKLFSENESTSHL